MVALNPKQRRFVSEYLIDQNATAAAKRAGYSPKTANEQGAQLLAKLSVKAEIEKRLVKIEAKSDLTQDRVRAAILQLLTFDPRKAFNADGTSKKIHEMPDDVSMAIAGIEADDAAGEIRRVRFIDRARVVEMAAKVLGMMRFEITGKGGRPLVPPASRIDFSGFTMDELKGLVKRSGNGAIPLHPK